MRRLQDAVLEFLSTVEGTRVSPPDIASRLKTGEFVHRVYDVAEGRLAEGGSVMPDVWELFLAQSQQVTLGEEALGKWQHAIEALMAYAFQAYLAPGRPEFQKIKVYSGYYRQHIGNFIASEVILGRLGYYKPQPDVVVFDQRISKSRNEVVDVIVAMLVLEQELELVRRVMHRAISKGLPVGLNVILAAKRQPHSSLEAFWNAVRHPPSVRPIPTQATNATPSSAVPNSPGHILPEELPAPAQTHTFTFDEREMDDLVNRLQDPALCALLAPRHDDAMRPENLPTMAGNRNSALSGHDERSSQGTPRPPDHWQCDDIDCQAKNPRNETQCIRCGRLAYWFPISPDGLGQASKGEQPLTGFPPVEQETHPPRTTMAASGGVMSSQTPTYWNCSHCTAENSYDNSRCSVCYREAFWITAPNVAEATHTPPSAVASGTATSRTSAHAPPIPAAIRTTTSSHPWAHTPLTTTGSTVATPSRMSPHTPPIATAREAATSSRMPNGWTCRNCATVNSYAESKCRKCNVESFLTTASPVGVGVDSTRRIETDGPVVQKMHTAREECPQCMFLISPGEDCPTCKNYTFGGAKAKKPFYDPRSWF